jgi:hypothetical protein
VLNGPSSLTTGESYALSWTNVLARGPRVAGDTYELQRAADPGFTTLLDRVATARPSQTLAAPPAGVTSVSHRVLVFSSACGTATSGSIVSNVVTTPVRAQCDEPAAVGHVEVNPETPPAFSTYVVSWDAGNRGPGNGAVYRLRRVVGSEVKESVLESGSASFQDAPGTYTYQVRAEASCGSVGPWSEALVVIVGATPVPALALVSDPKPVVAIAGSSAPATSFTVRNTGTQTLTVDAVAGDLLSVSPAALTLKPGESRTLAVTAALTYPSAAPTHGLVVLASQAGRLKVPIDVTVAATPAESPVVWSEADADVDDDGNVVRRILINTGATRAAIVGAVGADWLHVEAAGLDAWDAPMTPGERRSIRVVTDRGKRRATFGTETGVVSVTTAGFPDAPARLLVVDDGPPPVVATGVRPAATGAKARLLYASMPNAKDAHGVGRFTSDLWVTNLDAVSPVDFSIWATPIGVSDALVVSAHIEQRLGPGETRRYRNLMRRLFPYDGACEMEIRSPASTISATAHVSNTPIASAATTAKVKALATDVNAVPVTPGQYGFEMRPTAPGEGVKSSDPTFVVSGLAHDAKRRTNLILTETTGVATTVNITMLDNAGRAIEKNGAPVEVAVEVGPLASVQVNDADLFGSGDYLGPYALVYFQGGGSVMPFATVIDAGTEDASLRVGTSVRTLTPATPPAVASAKRALASSALALPFDGGPAPLLFPVAHIRGAALADGTVPYWKTRVTFTNVNESEQRQIEFRIQDQTGNATGVGGLSFIGLSPKASFTIDDVGGRFVTGDKPVYGAIVIDSIDNGSGDTWTKSWKDVDVQTETYTADTRDAARGEFKTGMEGFSYRHGYSSFQSNLGTVQIEGAESSSRYRTNLILEEVGGADCRVAVSAYTSGSFVPIATATVALPAFGYISRELFRDVLGLDRRELVDVRVVVRQLDGDGVFMAFASKINLTTGDPANIFLRPASAGTGR